MNGVIFDFNGTRFFDSPLHRKAWKEVAKEYFGRELSDKDIDENIQGRSNDLILSYLSPSPLSLEKQKEIADRKEVLYREMAALNPILAPGLSEFLSILKARNVPMAIATSSEKTNRAWYKKVFPLSIYFEEKNIVFDDGSFHKGKPDPEIYQVARRRLGLVPSSCLVFEDSLSGVKSAHFANAEKIILVEDEKCPPSFLVPPYVNDTISDYWPMKESVRSFLGL